MSRSHLKFFTPIDPLHSLPDPQKRMFEKGLVKVKEEIDDIRGFSYTRHKWVKQK